MEILVFLVCVKTTAIACENATAAYYNQSGIEKAITQKSQHYTVQYPTTAVILSYAAALTQNRLNVPISSTSVLTFDTVRHTMSYKFGF